MKVAIIGLGGVGSWFVEFLSKAFWAQQIPEDVIFEVYDHDTVSVANIQFQNYKEEDVAKNKAQAIADRYDVEIKEAEETFLTAYLEYYDFFIVAVDNFKTRQEVFEHCFKTGKKFLDMRAEGRNVFVLSKRDKGSDLSTLSKTDTTSGSCQRPIDVEKNRLQYSNIVAASIGLNMFVNILRGDKDGKLVILQV